ncbi:high mobility group B protein 14 [Silene latifolia]|uniref:high mobility group B protein 14 n=1 Tax=Silene latifolia TaxID=37657 RepID=UPI003D76DD2A
MVKRSSTSSKSATSSSSTPNNKKMVLRVKTPKNYKVDEYFGEEPKPISVKRAKSASLKKKGKFVDANKPKKPPTAFFFFMEDFRKIYQEEHPEVKSMRDIGKACGEKWRTMTYEEKVKYYDIATEKRAEFETALAEYTKRKESGEDPESEQSGSESGDE